MKLPRVRLHSPLATRHSPLLSDKKSLFLSRDSRTAQLARASTQPAVVAAGLQTRAFLFSALSASSALKTARAVTPRSIPVTP
jgi:hypothetical protein